MNQHGRWLTRPPGLFHLDPVKVSNAVGRRIDRIAIVLDHVGWVTAAGAQRWLRRGFLTDGGSIPGLGRLAGIDPYDGPALASCVGHDGDYTFRDQPDIIWGMKAEVDQHGILTFVPDPAHPSPRSLKKRDADRRLLEGMKAHNARLAQVYYAAVAIGGWGAWFSRDTGLIDGYAFACRSGTWDNWTEHVLSLYAPGDIVPLRADT